MQIQKDDEDKEDEKTTIEKMQLKKKIKDKDRNKEDKNKETNIMMMKVIKEDEVDLLGVRLPTAPGTRGESIGWWGYSDGLRTPMLKKIWLRTIRMLTFFGGNSSKCVHFYWCRPNGKAMNHLDFEAS